MQHHMPCIAIANTFVCTLNAYIVATTATYYGSGSVASYMRLIVKYIATRFKVLRGLCCVYTQLRNHARREIGYIFISILAS